MKNGQTLYGRACIEIETLKSDLIESYKAITEGHIQEDFTCEYCNNFVDMEFQGHKDDCIVIKAANYININDF